MGRKQLGTEDIHILLAHDSLPRWEVERLRGLEMGNLTLDGSAVIHYLWNHGQVTSPGLVSFFGKWVLRSWRRAGKVSSTCCFKVFNNISFLYHLFFSSSPAIIVSLELCSSLAVEKKHEEMGPRQWWQVVWIFSGSKMCDSFTPEA